MKLVTARQMQELDRQTIELDRVSQGTLMRRAAAAVASAAKEILRPRSLVMVLAGPGKNGGDAVLAATGAALSADLLERLPGDNTGLLRFAESIASLELSERDFLEIGEANVLLQKRPSVVIDTTSDFYLQALAQGFRHSDGFLNSGKTIFWIVDSSICVRAQDRVWDAHDGVSKLNLFFSQEPRSAGMN